MSHLNMLALKHKKVPAGNVAWHQSFEQACQAASHSGKPVLLFQMMGNLNDEFC